MYKRISVILLASLALLSIPALAAESNDFYVGAYAGVADVGEYDIYAKTVGIKSGIYLAEGVAVEAFAVTSYKMDAISSEKLSEGELTQNKRYDIDGLGTALVGRFLIVDSWNVVTKIGIQRLRTYIKPKQILYSEEGITTDTLKGKTVEYETVALASLELEYSFEAFSAGLGVIAYTTGGNETYTPNLSITSYF